MDGIKTLCSIDHDRSLRSQLKLQTSVCKPIPTGSHVVLFGQCHCNCTCLCMQPASTWFALQNKPCMPAQQLHV